MYTFLLVLLVIDAIILAAAVLMQAGKGGGVAANFGGTSSTTPSVIGSRQAGDLLTKTSWWGGGIFIFLAFVLQLMSTRASGPRSILDDIASPSPAQSLTAPATSPDVPTSAIPLQLAPTSAPPQP